MVYRKKSVRTLDTIGAIATATKGMGGIGIVRVSGNYALNIAYKLVGFYPPPRISLVCFFYDRNGKPIDRGIVVFFKKPYTYTGEDVVELHCHGSSIITKKLLEEVLYLGARQAQPGEFSARAFLNRKLTLLQVEALSVLVGSNLQSKDSGNIVLNTVQNYLLTLLERFIFFFYIKVDFYTVTGADGDCVQKNKDIFLFYFNILRFFLLKLDDDICFLFSSVTRKHIFLIGQTNTGKSSLLNSISRKIVSLVHKFPGTTRDIVCYETNIRGRPLLFYDTAGFNFRICNKVELCGLSLLKNKIKINSILLLMFDLTKYSSFYANRFYIDIFRDLLEDTFVFYNIKNKIDYFNLSTFMYNSVFAYKFFLSAKTKNGVCLLINKITSNLDDMCSRESCTDTVKIIQKKIRKCITHTTGCLKRSKEKDYEAVRSSLKYCHEAIADILGHGIHMNVNDLFSRFCVGK